MERNLLYRELSAGLQTPQTESHDHFLQGFRDILPGVIRYLGVGVGGKLPARTGVYVPKGFRPGADGVDVVVYFHGHILPRCGNDSGDFAKKGIEHYWHTVNFKCLWTEFDAAGSNAILLAPTLGANSSHRGQFGTLGEPNRFDEFIKACFQKMSSEGILPANTRTRHIILAGHSGGGRPINAILAAKNQLSSNIVECWGFDSQYFGDAPLRCWLNANPGKSYYHFAAHSSNLRTKSTPWNKAEELVKSGFKNAYNITPPRGEKLGHCHAVKRWWKTRLRDCAWLHDKSGSPK